MRGIYKLNFLGTDKVYIGQAENISRRFSEHLRTIASGTASKKLLQAVSEYGPPISFDVLCEIPTGIMDKEENLAIEIYDSFANGFNTFRQEGGSLRSQSGLDHSNSKYSKMKILKIFSLLYRTTMTYTAIANRTKTTKYIVANIASGSHRWLSEAYPSQYKLMQAAKANRNIANVKSIELVYGKIPKIVSPTGEIFEVSNIRQFCMAHADLAKNVDSARSSLGKLIKGTKLSHLGWKLYSE